MTATAYKSADRGELIRDSAYFSGELLKRLERLALVDGRDAVVWRQTAILVRRVRSALRSRVAT